MSVRFPKILFVTSIANGDGATQQSLPADGAIACFSSNYFPLAECDRAPQLKRNVAPGILAESKTWKKSSTVYV